VSQPLKKNFSESRPVAGCALVHHAVFRAASMFDFFFSAAWRIVDRGLQPPFYARYPPLLSSRQITRGLRPVAKKTPGRNPRVATGRKKNARFATGRNPVAKTLRPGVFFATGRKTGVFFCDQTKAP